MTDNLPLIPGKGAVCGDVRGVLRGVFRDLGAPPPAPPPHAAPRQRTDELPHIKDAQWKNKYSSECEKFSICELALRQEYAQRIARSPRSNLYQICEVNERSDPSERSDCEPRLKRRHLAPDVRQHATRETSLWVRNIKCSSSEILSVAPMPQGGQWPSQTTQPSVPLPVDNLTLCSLSIGSVRAGAAPPSPPAPPAAPPPDYILCVPPRLDFVNFVIGHEHKQSVRLINVSKAELRLSVRPPARRELRVCAGARGQRVTAGAAALLHVCFTPRDVRALHEDLLVRVSAGRALVIPIACYIQPPILDVLVPLEPALSLSCTPDTCAMNLELATESGAGGGDVLELGAQLLGDLHRVPLLLHCREKHAAFFLLSEDSWIDYTLDGITSGGAVVSGPFAWAPAWWRGGGGARGAAWCRARSPGLHAAAFRLLCSTAAVRPLYLLADSLHFRRDHITLQAHEKDYDVCSDDDPACEYYVHLGTAFPGHSLATTVQLINHSPVSYSYYWSVRPWGVCSCRGDDCEGALPRRSQLIEKEVSVMDRTLLGGVRVEPRRGRAAPRSVCALHVCAPDVGTQLGVQRATLMLILKDIPKESFPPGYDPMVISCETVDSEPMPGVPSEPREVCEVVCCEMEVWWEVAPVRFVLDPPLIRLSHSRRVSEARVTVRATQLLGREPVAADWRLPPGVPPPAAAAVLTPAQSLTTEFIIPLPSFPDQVAAHEKFDVIELVSKGEEWRSCCRVCRAGDRRALQVAPPARWRGVVAPGAHVATDLVVLNDTYQNVQWSCRAVRWCGAVAGSARCAGRAPCERCRVKGCACALLWPTTGELLHGANETIRFAVYAPKRDGCVLILVNARRALLAGDCGRAALIAFRVLAPRLVVRVMECGGNHEQGSACECCALDARAGSAVARPRAALCRGRAACCRLRVTNLTPVPSFVVWETPPNDDEPLRVMFLPNEFAVGPYEHVEIQVVLQPERVCARRVFVRRALADHSSTPLYVLVDTDIAGVEVTCEVPLGAGAEPSAAVLVRRTQKEVRPGAMQEKPTFEEDIFEAFERQQIEYRKKLFACRCAAILPHRESRPPPTTDPPRIQERLRREPLCLQFEQLPLATVRSRTVVLHNVSVLPARWSARVRRWSRKRSNTLAVDKWAVDVRHPGLVIEISPTSGMLAPGRGKPLKRRGDTARLSVEVYADCAGLYHDQLLIQIEHVEPIILDVWVEALGPPLAFAAAPRPDIAPVLWMSSADERRVVRARNTMRSRLRVTASLLKDHDDERDREPLRLYMRLQDAEPPAPPASDDLSWGTPGEASSACSSAACPPPAAPVELSIYADHGLQEQTPYTVEPEVCVVEAGADICWQVLRCCELEKYLSTSAVLMLRCEPLDYAGDNWFRPAPPPQTVRVRLARRRGRVQLAASEVRVKVCALSLPYNDVLRVRKRFQVLNVGDGPLSVVASVREPWTLVSEGEHPAKTTCGTGCVVMRKTRTRAEELQLDLKPRSSTEVCVEVSIPATAASPTMLEETESPRAVPRYQPTSVTTTPFILRDEVEKHDSMKLVLELEYPVVRVQPELIDFGFVTDGDTRKTYFTVSHSSRTETLDLVVRWRGTDEFRLEPTSLRVPPGDQRRVYVQYTARWSAAPVEGKAAVSARGRAWCGAAAACRGAPVRDHSTRAPPRDHTDDPVLLPPECTRYCSQ